MKTALILIISLLFFSCSPTPQKKNYFKMDTIVEITIFQEKSTEKIEQIFSEIENLLTDWDNRFAPSSENSEVLRVNLRTNDTLEISDDLFEMIETALDFSQKTDGAFDISVKPLKDFWNIGGTGEFLPDPKDTNFLDTLAKILNNIDYRKIVLLENPKCVIFENSEMQIDLGGIAKGFVIDKIRRVLEDNGIKNFIVNIGGDIFVMGEKRKNKKIIVGVKNPREGGLLRVMPKSRGALVTSGDYERFRIAQSGARVHHIFDTKTGFPVSKNIAISISGESIIVADILATGLFSFSESEIREKINAFQNYEFLLVDSTQNVHSTQNFGK